MSGQRTTRTRLLAAAAMALVTGWTTAAWADPEADTVYMLRFSQEVSDGRSVVSTSRDSIVARGRRGDRSVMLHDLQSGAVTVERADRVTATPIISTRQIDVSQGFDYRSRIASGGSSSAVFNLFLRPLLRQGPPAGQDGEWQVVTSLAALGLTPVSGGQVTIRLRRTALVNDGSPVVLIEYEIPAFTYRRTEGETVVHWAHGFAVTDRDFAQVHALGTQHRASVTGGDGASRPISIRTSLHGIDRAGGWLMQFANAPEIRAAVERTLITAGDRVSPVTQVADTIPARSFVAGVSDRLDQAVFALGEGGVNPIGQTLAANTSSPSSNPEVAVQNEVNAAAVAAIMGLPELPAGASARSSFSPEDYRAWAIANGQPVAGDSQTTLPGGYGGEGVGGAAGPRLEVLMAALGLPGAGVGSAGSARSSFSAEDYRAWAIANGHPVVGEGQSNLPGGYGAEGVGGAAGPRLEAVMAALGLPGSGVVPGASARSAFSAEDYRAWAIANGYEVVPVGQNARPAGYGGEGVGGAAGPRLEVLMAALGIQGAGFPPPRSGGGQGVGNITPHINEMMAALGLPGMQPSMTREQFDARINRLRAELAAAQAQGQPGQLDLNGVAGILQASNSMGPRPSLVTGLSSVTQRLGEVGQGSEAVNTSRLTVVVTPAWARALAAQMGIPLPPDGSAPFIDLDQLAAANGMTRAQLDAQFERNRTRILQDLSVRTNTADDLDALVSQMARQAEADGNLGAPRLSPPAQIRPDPADSVAAWIAFERVREATQRNEDETLYRLLRAQIEREIDEARRDERRRQQRQESGIDSLDAFVRNNAFTYTSMVGVVPTDLSRWAAWLATQNVRELERLARLAGYPNLASALNDSGNLIRQAEDQGYRRWAQQAPSCGGLIGCGPSYLERWWMRQATVSLGDILADSRDVFSTGGFSDVGISRLNLSYLLRDNALEDGDIVDVRITQFGRVLFQGRTNLTNLGERYGHALRPGVATLEIFAVNEGFSPPNTAEITLDNVVRGNAAQSYSLSTGETAVLRIETNVGAR
jgi:hypothetical protein